MGKLIVLDTQILIWGLKGVATPGQEGMISRAQSYFRASRKAGDALAMSAVTLGELLVAVPDEYKSAFIDLAGKMLVIHPFDTLAALHAAKVHQAWKGSASSTGMTIQRSILKADIQIIGTALARKAALLVSNDEQLRKVASGFLPCINLPILEEPELFDTM